MGVRIHTALILRLPSQQGEDMCARHAVTRETKGKHPMYIIVRCISYQYVHMIKRIYKHTHTYFFASYSPTCYVAVRSREWPEARPSWRPCRSHTAPPRTPEPRRAETGCLFWPPMEGRECRGLGRSAPRARTLILFAESAPRGILVQQ